MGNRVFGHVGDRGPVTMTSDLTPPPHFDQVQVDYLKKVFAIGQPCPIIGKTIDDAVAMVAWTSQDQGNRDVISHIETLIAQQQKAGQ